MVRLLFIAPIMALAAIPVYFFLQGPPPLPDLPLDEWWGPPETKGKASENIKPFRIKFKEEMIQDLKQRIKITRLLPAPLEGVNHEYGFNSNQVQDWLKYWSEEYDFAERQKFFNQYEHYKTNIQGLNIHFINVRPEVPANVELVPVLMLHGWPGSVREFYEAIPLLTAYREGQDFALELIIPSLPGYGFSDHAVRPGLGAAEMAVVFRNLMHRLGFQKYYVQGGDWGALIGSNLVTLFPNEVFGFHTNVGGATHSSLATLIHVFGSLFPSLVVDEKLADRMYPVGKFYSFILQESGYMHLQATKPDTDVLGFHTNLAAIFTAKASLLHLLGAAYPSLIVDDKLADRMYPLGKFYSYILQETGYMHIQASKPDTVGVAVSDSPAGILAYVLEKFSTWTDKNQKPLTQLFTKEQLIDNIMCYWSTNSMTTAMRLYSESFNKKQMGYKLMDIPTPVPTWVAQAKYELGYQPPFMLRMKFPNLVNVTVLETGGHFLALEMPKEFSQDVVRAVAEFRKLRKTKTEL